MAEQEARLAPAMPDNATLEQRVASTVAFLNQRGYLARYERQGEMFNLYTVNCPYSGVSEQHRELCLMDLRLISQLLGAPPAPVDRLVDGDCCCTYRIGSPQGERALAQTAGPAVGKHQNSTIQLYLDPLPA